MGNELRHYGILGMKWGVRRDVKSKGRSKNFDPEKKKFKKSDYDRNLLMQDEKHLREDELFSRGSAKRVARNTQKRMHNKNESHDTALRKATSNSLLRSAGAYAAVGLGRLAMHNPKVQQAANNGAWALGRKSAQAADGVRSIVSNVSKIMDRDIVSVNPIDATRGRDIVGLLLDRR